MFDVSNRLLSKAANDGVIKGISMGRQGISLSHLQFTNGMILFAPAKLKMLLNIRRMLDCFRLMSGLRINYEKSAIIAINCSEGLVVELSANLRCQLLTLPLRYLGIPLHANPRKEETREPIVGKIRKRLSG